MKWMLVVIIGLCWCEVDAATEKCATEKECRDILSKDWHNTKLHVSLTPKLTSSDKNFLAGLSPTQSGEMRPNMLATTPGGIRKECRTLTDDERTRLHNAFKFLFTNKAAVDSLDTLYQVYIGQHRSTSAPDAHFGPCFPGFHREFLVRFTNALKKFDPSVELCYWDSSLDYSLPDAAQSCLWTDEYWGNGNGVVTSGFAANQPVYPSDCASQGATLSRDVGGNSYLFTPTKISTIYASCSNFTKLMTPYGSNNFENYHGSVHVFVYGHMSVISCSVNDPTFWFHHCFIDYLWEKCRALQKTNKETDYPRDSGVPANHHYYDPMKPFQNKTCIDGCSTGYIPGIYSYAPSPSTCIAHADCGGKALWCNSGKCTACVQEGGKMGSNWPDSACYITDCTTPKNDNAVCTCSS